MNLAVPRAWLVNSDGDEREWRSELLPRYRRSSPEVEQAVLGVYLSGGNTRRIRGALKPLLRGAPLSKSAVSRRVNRLEESYERWRQRDLAAERIVYLYLDAIFPKVRSAQGGLAAGAGGLGREGDGGENPARPGQRGIKTAARAFQTTLRTVRKWRRRYQEQGPKGLEELSRAPRSCPHKTGGEREQQVLALRRQLPTFSAQRLRRDFQLPVSPMTAYRIWHTHGLVARRRRKYQRKQDLAARKATWALFQQISTDTKDLDDIPHYWAQMKARHLPAIQYSAREVRSGLQFLAFAARRSAGASALFAHRIQSHLQHYGVNLKDVTWQTDNGGEFIGARQPDGSRSGFPRAVTFFGSQHVRVPPAAHTYQSDVETVHRWIEDEFYGLESFSSRAERTDFQREQAQDTRDPSSHSTSHGG